MSAEQKRLIECLIEIPQAKTEQIITLLSTWLDAERDNETRNMICVALTCAREIDQSLNDAMEGK
ncbi:hypothetical protein [Xenorhabdus griffiniae]|uniref:Prophage protein n=1 Tax=Xenorhabdus griffiniae TaxID=351672 RepID=A0ABY9XDK2_9GAMM|nr:hypothetical protein [Xenorhabdus griffiniae]MBD1228983.1 hypothetical protein [Xenorhabdus griffiniae]MBE8588918.1 hypothetical protein [Xenorhabdus griffiniae]WMV70983.1 hypothetical protein QL128_12310 [Xenorhabdus griffiniae]WNH00659.1 hypothetical protein QL112_012315 [Xenorhabdus griffiniae]